MSENTNPQEPRQPRNLFEQILFGVQVTNDNIVTLHGRVDALKSLSQVGTGRYVATVHVEGIISYVPCNGGCGCTKQQPLSQDFTIPIQSASTPTVTIEQGAAMNAVAASACQPCSRTFVSETPITVTVATAATPTA